MKAIFLRSAFNYDADEVSAETGIVFDPDDGVTHQSFAEEVDINTIVKRFGVTGQLPNGIHMPMSGDFTELPDFQSALNMVRQSEEEFMKLPAEVRKRFDNDPGMLIRFLEDGSNKDEAIKLGIVAAPVEETRKEEVPK